MTSASAGRSHGGFWADGRIHQRLAFESDGVLGVARTRALQRAASASPSYDGAC